MFSIEPDGIKHDAQIIKDTGLTIQSHASQLNAVSDDLASLSSFDKVVEIIRVLSNQAKDEGIKNTMLGMALEQIVKSYLITEKSIINNIRGPVTSIFETSEVANAVNLVDSGTGKRDNDVLMNKDPADMDKFIAEFEKNNPDIAAEFNRIFSGGNDSGVVTADDIRRIKYLAYTAREPYRSIYLKNLDKITVRDWDEYDKDANGNDIKTQGQAFFSKDTKDLVFNHPGCFEKDPRGQYTTIFHESGHAIDDLIDPATGSDSDTFIYNSAALGANTTIYDAICYDVYDNPNNPHSVAQMLNDINSKYNNAFSQYEIQDVTNYMKSAVPYNSLSTTEKALVDELTDYMKQSIPYNERANYEAVTDVYGAVTNNVLLPQNYFGHRKAGYWSDTTNAGKELWAEYFSYNMAGDTSNLEYLREYFPEAAKAMDQYANYLSRKTNGGAR